MYRKKSQTKSTGTRPDSVSCVIGTGQTKIKTLDSALVRFGFQDLLRRVGRKHGSKARFAIKAIKLDIMMLTDRENDRDVMTDPFLVEHLIDLILKSGFRYVSIVEAQNVYGNWIQNRDVLAVAKYAGYSGRTRNGREYQIVDMSLDTIDHRFPPEALAFPDEKVPVGREWAQADCRINFAKFKTHPSTYTTLCLQNVYRCLPAQDKFWNYRRDREMDEAGADMALEFPAHLCLIDAWTGSDNIYGFKHVHSIRHPGFILAGRDILDVEAAALMAMGLDPRRSSMWRLAAKRLGRELDSKIVEEKPWRGRLKRNGWRWVNVPRGIGLVLNIVGGWNWIINLWRWGSIRNLDEEAFPVKEEWSGRWHRRWRKAALWLDRIIEGAWEWIYLKATRQKTEH